MEDFNAGSGRALVMANTKPEYQEVYKETACTIPFHGKLTPAFRSL